MERGLRQVSGHVDRQSEGSIVTRAENREAQRRTERDERVLLGTERKKKVGR